MNRVEAPIIDVEVLVLPRLIAPKALIQEARFLVVAKASDPEPV
jgi:hypothetical protein